MDVSREKNGPVVRFPGKLSILALAAIATFLTAGTLDCQPQGKSEHGGSADMAGNERENPAGANPCQVIDKNAITPTTPYISSISNDVTLVLRDLDGCLRQQGAQVSDLRVALDGTMLPNLLPISGPATQNYVKFTFRIDPYDRDDRARWAKIIRAMRRSDSGVSFTLFNKKTEQMFESGQTIVINLYPSYTPFVVVGLIVLLIGLIVLGIRSNMLRENPSGQKHTDINLPLSLGRVQMAFWFYLVISGYLYIWLLTGQSYTPTGSILALLGISSATGFAAEVVDRNKASDSIAKRKDLEIQKLALESRIQEIETTNPAPGSDIYTQFMDKKDQLTVVSL